MGQLPAFEATVFTYGDKVRAECKCNICGDLFTIVLGCNPVALQTLPKAWVNKRIFQIADQRHTCPDAYDIEDKPETNRIVNKYHETKEKLIKTGKK